MKRVEIEADQMPGQDSFLDVITNIVGILILLVLVVGLKTSRSVVQEAAESASVDTANEMVTQAVHSAAAAERDVDTLVQRVSNSRQELLVRNQERLWLTSVLTEAEQEIAAKRDSLNKGDQRDFDLRRQIAEAQLALDHLTREQMALMDAPGEVAEIRCEPTHLAKYVTGKEVHVLLQDDHLAVVPFEELLGQMKDDAMANVWRLRELNQFERTLGPVNGFRITYLIVRREIVAQQGGSVMSGAVPEFSHCEFLPEVDPIGEPAAEAMEAGSEFLRFLQNERPGTTVTFWTYPGNYDRLRELKRLVRDHQLQVAVRALPHGVRIMAGPGGNKSVIE